MLPAMLRVQSFAGRKKTNCGGSGHRQNRREDHRQPGAGDGDPLPIEPILQPGSQDRHDAKRGGSRKHPKVRERGRTKHRGGGRNRGRQSSILRDQARRMKASDTLSRQTFAGFSERSINSSRPPTLRPLSQCRGQSSAGEPVKCLVLNEKGRVVPRPSAWRNCLCALRLRIFDEAEPQKGARHDFVRLQYRQRGHVQGT